MQNPRIKRREEKSLVLMTLINHTLPRINTLNNIKSLKKYSLIIWQIQLTQRLFKKNKKDFQVQKTRNPQLINHHLLKIKLVDLKSTKILKSTKKILMKFNSKIQIKNKMKEVKKVEREKLQNPKKRRRVGEDLQDSKESLITLLGD